MIIIILCCNLQSGTWTELFAGLATLGAAYIVYRLSKNYNESMKSIEEDRIKKDLFTEFNTRYDKLNDDLMKIVKLGNSAEGEPQIILSEHQKNILNDYFNLCSEEFYWFKKDRVDLKAWRSWCYGMKYFYNSSKTIKKNWDNEMNNDGYRSHYLLYKEELFDQFLIS